MRDTLVCGVVLCFVVGVMRCIMVCCFVLLCCVVV